MVRYYFDTCIWRDFYESRIGLRGKPLGKYAADLFIKVIRNKDALLYSELTLKELKADYSEKEVNDMLNLLFLSDILKMVDMKKEEYVEAKKIAEEKKVPAADVLHAVLARDNGAIFVSQDQHAQELADITIVKKPEEID